MALCSEYQFSFHRFHRPQMHRRGLYWQISRLISRSCPAVWFPLSGLVGWVGSLYGGYTGYDPIPEQDQGDEAKGQRMQQHGVNSPNSGLDFPSLSLRRGSSCSTSFGTRSQKQHGFQQIEVLFGGPYMRDSIVGVHIW